MNLESQKVGKERVHTGSYLYPPVVSRNRGLRNSCYTPSISHSVMNISKLMMACNKTGVTRTKGRDLRIEA